ncbi:hypothetical protein Ddc_20157 [Ditylenchus destructor]|nr:hypothetical protein Ddc_20157 [Ditylenchus destructor]
MVLLVVPRDQWRTMAGWIDEWLQGVTLSQPLQWEAWRIHERDEQKADFIVLAAYNAILHVIDGKAIGGQHRL